MMKMKKTSALLALMMALTAAPAFAAETPAAPVSAASDVITVTVDGTAVSFDQPPVIQDNRTLVPMRAIFEALGAYVDWDQDTQTVTAEKRADVISLTIGSAKLQVNEKNITLDVPARVINSRTLVPVRAISEALGADVQWDGAKKLVTIVSKQGAHQITDKYVESEIKDDNGHVVLTGRAAYPVVANPDKSSAIDSLNAAFAKAANDYISSLSGEPAKLAKEAHMAADQGKELNVSGSAVTGGMVSGSAVTGGAVTGSAVSASAVTGMPYEYEMSFDVTYDKGNTLSVTTQKVESTGGAHPNTIKNSAVYDLTTGKKLALTDIMNGTQSEIEKQITDGFTAMIDKDAASYLADAKTTLSKEISNVEFYLNEDGIHFYFQLYTIAPYAAGFPEYTIAYTAKDTFKLADLTGEKKENTTTGGGVDVNTSGSAVK